jgi:uncharacterized membrane protein YuzA (DUF378 family)
MESIKRLEPIWLLLTVLGALNWGIVGLFDENVFTDVFGNGRALDAVYTVIGLAGLMMVPALMRALQVGGMHPHAHSH